MDIGQMLKTLLDRGFSVDFVKVLDDYVVMVGMAGTDIDEVFKSTTLEVALEMAIFWKDKEKF